MAKGFIFDMDGTLVDNISYHNRAWAKILAGLGMAIPDTEVGSVIYGNNEEILIRLFGEGKFSKQEIFDISDRKEMYYQSFYKPYLKLLEGCQAFLQDAKEKQFAIGMGTASYESNVNFVVDNLAIRPFFDAIISGEQVVRSKPDPETFLKAAAALQLAPRDCIVFEDSLKGVEAAAAAGMQTVVITTGHAVNAFNGFQNIITFATDYTSLKPDFLHEN
jgi:beta-phosphoglucomutase